MISDQLLDQLRECASDSAKLLDAIQREVRDEAEIVARGLMKRMDLVPRDEYEALEKMLERTRARLELLEQRLASLERGEQGQ